MGAQYYIRGWFSIAIQNAISYNKDVIVHLKTRRKQQEKTTSQQPTHVLHGAAPAADDGLCRGW